MSLEWRIYYGDDSTFTNLDGSPWDAPAVGVVAITVADPSVGRWVARASDYYVYDPAQFTPAWEGVDTFGLWDYLTQPGPRKVLFGRTYQNAIYQRILHRALNDPDMPPKSARYPSEHPMEVTGNG